MVCVQLGGEIVVVGLQLLDDLCVVDGGMYFELVVDDVGVVQQVFDVVFVIGGYGVYIEIVVGGMEVFVFFQDGFLVQFGLVDFQDQLFEQFVFVVLWEVVFVVVVVVMYGMVRGDQVVVVYGVFLDEGGGVWMFCGLLLFSDICGQCG